MADKKNIASRVSKKAGERARVDSVERSPKVSKNQEQAASKPRGTRKPPADIGGTPRKEPVLSKAGRDAGRPAAKAGLSTKVNVGQAVASPKNLIGAQGSKAGRTKTVSKREHELDDRKAKHESRSLSRGKPLVRERTRTRTISPREEKSPAKQPAVATKEEEKEKAADKDEKDDYDEETFEVCLRIKCCGVVYKMEATQDYESDFEDDEEEEEASSTHDERHQERPREMVSLPEPAARPISALSTTNDHRHNRIARRESRGDLLASPEEETRLGGSGGGEEAEMKAIAPVIGEQTTIAKKAPALPKSFPHQQQQQQQKQQQRKENNNAEQSGQQTGTEPEEKDNQPPIHSLATQQIKMLKMMRLDVVNCGSVEIAPESQNFNKASKNEGSDASERRNGSVEKWTQHPAKQNDDQQVGGGGSGGGGSGSAVEEVAVELSELLRDKTELERAVENVGLGAEIANLAKEGVKLAARSGALTHRPPKMLHFAEPARLISVHLWQEGDESAGELLFVWALLADTEHPFYVLGSRGRVTCLCVPPSTPSIVLAATQDGTVCLWDLQEPASNHSTMLLGSQTLVVRSPTFTTALLKGSHVFAVRGLCIVAGGEQVASVDQEGEMAVWSVVWPSGGRPDATGRGCHLVRSAQRNLRAELADGESAEVTDVASAAERLLVAFDTALVVAFSPLSSIGRIKKYPPIRGPVLGETKVAVNPHSKNIFAVLDGFGDVSVFEAQHSRPVWRLAAHAATLSWARSGLLLLHADRARLSLWRPPLAAGDHAATQLAACQLHSKVDHMIASTFTDTAALTTCDGELVSISIRRDLSTTRK